MQIQYVSDIHLEFTDNRDLVMNNWKSVGDVLVLAGDICSKRKIERLYEFLELIKGHHKHVIYVPGNHEYYGSDLATLKEEQGVIKQISPNVFCINNHTLTIEGVSFICSTMWSGISFVAAQYLSDYRAIKDYTFNDENEIHENSVKFLNEEIQKQKEEGNKIVVVTHHLPSFQCISEKYKGNPINSGFAGNEDAIMQNHPEIKYWIHGHSHDRSTFQINQSLVCRNPLGYVQYDEHKAYNFETVINI
jgi:Icc-related predicted phosphoesterase